MQHVLVIDLYPNSILDSIKKLHKYPEYQDLAVKVLTRNPEEYVVDENSGIEVEISKCDFNNDAEISKLLHGLDIAAVICRGDKQIQFLRKVLPHLPNNVLVASEKALAAATNKKQMRQCFSEHYPEITPKFIEVIDASPDTLIEIENTLNFPVVIKPANLASSLLIQACKNLDELRFALTDTFTRIKDIYSREERKSSPQIIVEEFLEGDLYSIDAYVLDTGSVFYCPPVAYITANQLGIDDFALYKRFVPTSLSEAEVDEANTTCEKAIKSIGLTHSSAHIELVKTLQGWKIIEIGPRLGRFRNTMYAQAYGIDHSLNDLLIHLGQKPEIPTKLLQYCAAYTIYPSEEGVLDKLNGLDKLKNSSNIYALKIYGKKGDYCKFAKNGGKTLTEFVIASPNKSEYQGWVNYIEKEVRADISIEKN